MYTMVCGVKGAVDFLCQYSVRYENSNKENQTSQMRLEYLFAGCGHLRRFMDESSRDGTFKVEEITGRRAQSPGSRQEEICLALWTLSTVSANCKTRRWDARAASAEERTYSQFASRRMRTELSCVQDKYAFMYFFVLASSGVNVRVDLFYAVYISTFVV